MFGWPEKRFIEKIKSLDTLQTPIVTGVAAFDNFLAAAERVEPFELRS